MEYQEARKAKLNYEELAKINLKLLSVGGIKFTSFFQATKDAGLYDKMEQEMSPLKLDTVNP